MTQPAFFNTDWSVLSVTGPDAVSFLHNMCTNDIKRLQQGECCEALFTDVKAHVLAHTVVCRSPGDGCQVIVTSPAVAELATHLDRYHIREELEMRVEAELQSLVVTDAEAAMQAAPKTVWYPLPALSPRAALVIASKRWSDDLFEKTFNRLDRKAFDRLRIENGFPLDRIDVDERNLPQELNRDAALISFTKGCYLGQETVARIDALGRVNQLWTPLHIEGERSPQAGDQLQAGEKPIGRITSVCRSANEDGWSATAYLRREHAVPGTELTGPDASYRGVVNL